MAVQQRSSGKFAFLQLIFGTAEIQAVVFKGNVSDEVFRFDKITQETSIEVKGTVKKHDRSKIGYEIDVIDVKIIGSLCIIRLHLKNTATIFMEHRHSWLRSTNKSYFENSSQNNKICS